MRKDFCDKLIVEMLLMKLNLLFLCCFTEEITTQRDMLSTSENSLAAFMSTVLPIAENPQTLYTTNDHHSIQKGVSAMNIGNPKLG